MRQKFITKRARFFIAKYDSCITKCDSCYKLRRFYYKMRRLLQTATVHIDLVNTETFNLPQKDINNKESVRRVIESETFNNNISERIKLKT